MEDKTPSEPATKADLKELATKAELKAVEQKLSGRIDSVETTVKHIAIELAKTQADVREIKRVMVTKDDFNRLYSTLDGIAGYVRTYQREDTLRGDAVMRHETQIKDHETRLTALETK